MKKTNIILAIASLLLIVSCGTDTPEKASKGIALNKIPVETEQVQYSEFHHYIEITGMVEPVQYAFISPESSGQIKQILVSEGQTVQKNDVLVKLNSSVIDGQIQQLSSQLNLATITYQKQAELWNKKHVGSEMQFLQAKAQKESLESQLESLESQKQMSIIKAPFSGVIDKINLKEGELASPGMQLIELVNLNKIKIKADVSESLLPVIHKGDSVIVTFPTYKNLVIKAPIYRTGNIINPANRTFTIEIRTDNIDNKLKPFMISSLKINDYSLKDALTVPSIIIKKDFDKEFIFIAQQTDSSLVAQKVYIKSGRSFNEQSVVISGLNINDRVITKGYNTVSTGVAIKILKK